MRNRLYYFYLNNKDGSEKEDIKLKELASWRVKAEEHNPQGLNYLIDSHFEDNTNMTMSFLNEGLLSIEIKGVTITITEGFIGIKKDKDSSMLVELI